jgi:hypothetical protein
VLTDPANFVALHLRWFLAFVIALGGAGGWYYSVARSAIRWPGGSSASGLAFGILAGLIILFEFALWLRKTRLLRTSRVLGNAQLWMKAHIWLGLLVVPLAVMHSGFSFGGTFTAILMWVLLVVIASGIFGLLMQNILPRWMLEHVPGETVFSQIDIVKRQYADEAARIVFLSCSHAREPMSILAVSSTKIDSSENRAAAARIVGAQRRVGTIMAKTAEGRVDVQPLANSKPVWQAYEQVVRPFLETSRRSISRLSSRRRSHDYFDALRASAGDEGQETVNALEQLCDKTRDLNLQQRLHYLLHGWLAVHLPLSISLLILLVIHVIYALRIG